MHKIIFKELTFRNFMSYGNNLNKFSFRDGLLWLYGDNGFGKSTIVEAMTFALFGISYRGGTKADLRNSRNHPQNLPDDDDRPDVSTDVSLEFDVQQSDGSLESYKVYRSIYGKKDTIKFSIDKLEDGKWVTQNKRAGFSQADFEEKILQFNDILFKNVIAMNTQETVPFYLMPAAKKRELLESIISLSLDKWKKANGKRLSDATMAFGIAESDIKQFDIDFNEMNSIYQKMLEEKKNNVEQMKIDYDNEVSERNAQRTIAAGLGAEKIDIQANIESLRETLSKESEIDAEIRELNNAVSVLPMLNSAQTEYDSAFKKYSDLKAEYDTMNLYEKIDLLNTCNVSLDSLQNDSSFSRKCIEIQSELRIATRDRDVIADQGKKLVPGVPCPTCGKPSTEEDVSKHKAELGKQWKTLNAKVKDYTIKYNEADAALKSHDQEIEDTKEKVLAARREVERCQQFYNSTLLPAKSDSESAKNRLDHILAVIAKQGEDADAIKNKIADLTKVKERFSEIRENLDKAYDDLNVVNGKLSDVNSKISAAEKQISSLKAMIEKSESMTDDSVNEMKTKIERNRVARGDAEKRLHDASDTISICKSIASICSDTGMKKMVFGMFVPAFNNAVQKNIIKANLPFVVEFDDAMEMTFKSMPGLSKTYVMLSQGQKRKIGFAISMAFRDFVSLVGNFNVNFISLDEVLDISTDNNAMREMLDLAKSMVDDIGCAVVITHRGDVVADKFDYKLGVQYDGVYSRLGEIENA